MVQIKLLFTSKFTYCDIYISCYQSRTHHKKHEIQFKVQNKSCWSSLNIRCGRTKLSISHLYTLWLIKSLWIHTQKKTLHRNNNIWIFALVHILLATRTSKYRLVIEVIFMALLWTPPEWQFERKTGQQSVTKIVLLYWPFYLKFLDRGRKESWYEQKLFTFQVKNLVP